MSVEQAKVVILVFAMDGCPACKEYMPRLKAKITEHQQGGYPFVEYKEGMYATKGTIPVVIIDSQSSDPGVVALADQHGISALPTTVLLPRFGYPAKWEGALPDAEIDQLMQLAIVTNG